MSKETSQVKKKWKNLHDFLLSSESLMVALKVIRSGPTAPWEAASKVELGISVMDNIHQGGTKRGTVDGIFTNVCHISKKCMIL